MFENRAIMDCCIKQELQPRTLIVFLSSFKNLKNAADEANIAKAFLLSYCNTVKYRRYYTHTNRNAKIK